MKKQEETTVSEESASMPLREQVQKSKVRPKSYALDLRIHTPSSLGYFGIEGIDTAPALVRLAKVKGLDVIAVTDYYSGSFIDKVTEAAKGSPLVVLPGVDIRCRLDSCDDVVLTCLFPEGQGSNCIEGFLNGLSVPKSASGNNAYLVTLPFNSVLGTLEAFGGIAIPSRMDKTPYRLSVLPRLVNDYGFRAFNLAYEDSKAYFKKHWPKTKFRLFSFSNANALAQIGSRIEKVKMEQSGFLGIKTLVARETVATV